MRYLHLLLLVLGSFCSATLARAQDVILRTNGEELPAKVLTIQPEQISYVVPTAPADTLYLNVADVFMIKYANGTKELIHAGTTATAPSSFNSEAAYRQGEQDAQRYFKARGAFWGTFGATVVGSGVTYGLGGIVTGAAVTATKPPVRSMVVPDLKLLQNPAYVKGYQQQAQRKKLGKAAAGFGLGVGTLVVLVAIVLSHGFN